MADHPGSHKKKKPSFKNIGNTVEGLTSTLPKPKAPPGTKPAPKKKKKAHKPGFNTRSQFKDIEGF